MVVSEEMGRNKGRKAHRVKGTDLLMAKEEEKRESREHVHHIMKG